MRDPYDILGVQRSADAAAIKSAYRKLAKKLHPDANAKDPKAAQRFAELNSAYEILGDEAKRKQFDRGEIDAEGKPRFHGFEGAHPGGFGGGGGFESFSWGPEGFKRGGGGRAGSGFGGFEDILKDMFGGAAGAAGGRGGRRTGSSTQFHPDDFAEETAGRDVTASVTITLAEAARGGSRRVHLPTGKEVEVKIPAGLTDGQQIRLKGLGMPGIGAPGDALITVVVAHHPLFDRDGDNLRLDLPVTLYEAVLGAKVRVPTLEGAVELSIPPGTGSGKTFRLKGKGMPVKGGHGHGDLLVTIRIALPDQADPDLEALMKKWRDTKPYDPRRDMK